LRESNGFRTNIVRAITGVASLPGPRGPDTRSAVGAIFALPGYSSSQEAMMFTPTDKHLMQEACRHRAASWRGQAQQLTPSQIKDFYLRTAERLEKIAERLSDRAGEIDRPGQEVEQFAFDLGRGSYTGHPRLMAVPTAD
jgi:hypothetical protein